VSGGGERQAVGDPTGRAPDGQHERASDAGIHPLSRAPDGRACEEDEQQRRDEDGEQRVARAEAAQAVEVEAVHEAVVVGHRVRSGSR
jgi:hypothetical protein